MFKKSAISEMVTGRLVDSYKQTRGWKTKRNGTKRNGKFSETKRNGTEKDYKIKKRNGKPRNET
jgi:hypothetical protein